MEDPSDALQRHYQQQQLPADRVAAILAAGRLEGARRQRRQRIYWGSAMAALFVVGIFIAGSWNTSPASRAPLKLTDVSSAVVRFFGTPPSTLGQLSPRVASLQQWLAGTGAPAAFAIPRTMANFESLGCQVLEVNGQHVSLICFLLEAAPVASGAGSSPSLRAAPDNVAAAPNAPPPLVHLLVAPRSAFSVAPKVGEHVQLQSTGRWQFVAWTDNNLVFVAASDVAGLDLKKTVGAL